MWIDPDDSNNDPLYALGTYSNVPRAIKAASPHSLTHLVVQYAASLLFYANALKDAFIQPIS